MTGRILIGDCREVMPAEGPFDLIIADPPYGDTALGWDKRVEGWLSLAAASLKSSGSIWIFGSMRFFMATGPAFTEAGLKYAQDLVWSKHNGSGFAADRFRRVHEHVVQFYLAQSTWGGCIMPCNVSSTRGQTRARRRRRGLHPIPAKWGSTPMWTMERASCDR